MFRIAIRVFNPWNPHTLSAHLHAKETGGVCEPGLETLPRAEIFVVRSDGEVEELKRQVLHAHVQHQLLNL